ncbi:hypothetical protein ACFSJ3_18465 [Corallincola platygyrae]|uniref:Uncharacterized protein n=1 Tax=Corallincola platygyrae TaxID=1193278 RepID=A0ABW4XRL1_9GAMM
MDFGTDVDCTIRELVETVAKVNQIPLQSLDIVKASVTDTQKVFIDLVLRAPDGLILPGKRAGRPPINWWYVPGGRIVKDEGVE